MNAEEEKLLGLWVGYAHPLQESRVVFCADGNGMLFYFWGSCPQAPFVDTFSWSVEPTEYAKKLSATWDTFHGSLYDANDDEILPETVEADDASSDAVYPVHRNISALHEYFFEGSGTPQTLHILNNNEALSHVGEFARARPARTSDEERIALQHYYDTFNPFGEGQAAWTFTRDEKGEAHFRPASSAAYTAGAPIAVNEEPVTAEDVADLLHVAPNGRVLTVVFGIIGAIAYTGDYLRHEIPFWLRFVAVFPPLLIPFLDHPKNLRPWSVESRLYAVAAAWFFVLAAFLGTLAVVGLRPRGWWFYLLLCLPAIYTFAAGLSERGKACLNTRLK